MRLKHLPVRILCSTVCTPYVGSEPERSCGGNSGVQNSHSVDVDFCSACGACWELAGRLEGLGSTT